MSNSETEGYNLVKIEDLSRILEGYVERRLLNNILSSGELDHFKSLKRIYHGKNKKSYITSEDDFKKEMIDHMLKNKTYSKKIDKMFDGGLIDSSSKKEDEFKYPSIVESQREKAYWDKELVRQKALELQKELIQISEVEFIFETFTNYIKKQIEVLPKRMSDQIFLKFGVDKNQVKLCLDEEIRITLKDLQKDIVEYENKFSEKE